MHKPLGHGSGRNGFTIVELLVVIVVIAILATVVIVAYNGIVGRARETAVKSDLRGAADTLETESASSGSYPATDAAANSGRGLPKSAGITYQYSFQPLDNSYCLTATSAYLPGRAWHVSSSEGAIKDGACGGHSVAGAPTQPASCATGYIPVPGNTTFGTSGGFCVMKYELKVSGSVAVSTAAGDPALGFSYDDAVTGAANTCGICHVITESEWMTIAANVASVGSNWSSGSVGVGYIYSGHNDNDPANPLPASTSDSDGYYGTNNSAADSSVRGGVVGKSQRRTLTLTNGEVIWDFAGNAWEWTASTISGGSQPGITSETGYTWKEWTAPSLQMNGLPPSSRPSALGSQVATWTSSQGIGALYSDRTDTITKVYQRSGGWGWGAAAGILTLALDVSPSSGDADVGTRFAR